MKHYKIIETGQLIKETDASIKDSWVILSPKEFESHHEEFGISKKRMKCCDWQMEVAKVEIYQKYDFGLLNVISQIGSTFVKEPFYFYLAKDYLLFVVQNDLFFLQEIEQELVSDDEEIYTPGKILCYVITKIIKQNATLLDDLEKKLFKLEVSVFNREKIDVIETIIKYRKELAFIKKNCEPIIDIVRDIEENGNHLTDEATTSYLTRLGHRVDRFNEQMLHISDYITQVRETYDSMISGKINEVTEVLGVVTAICLPVTIINGWYGMNITMPEMEWEYSYLYVTIFSIISVIVCVVIFKKKKWLN